MLLLKTLIHAALLPGTFMLWAPLYILSARGELRRPPVWGAAELLGLCAFAAGVALMAWCMTDFVRRGRGTPNPLDPPRKLVARGPYRRTRNPMYVAAVAAILGEALVFRSPALGVYAAAVLLVFHLFVVLYEEPSLRRRFGAAYDEYCREVPRWLGRRAGRSLGR